MISCPHFHIFSYIDLLVHEYIDKFVFRLITNKEKYNKLIFNIKNKHTAEKANFDTPEGFECTYLLYSKKMYQICYSKVNNTEAAREIVQEIFKSLWERKGTIEVKGNIEGYLMGALKLRIIDYYRSQTAKQKHLDCALADYCGHGNCTEDVIRYNELQNKISILVDSLPCQCKNVYKMSREQGLSTKEIASALLISERAVTYHLTRATTFLKEELAEYI